MSVHGKHSAHDPRVVTFVCQGPSCSERGGTDLLERLRTWLLSFPARRHVRVCASSCLDSCATGPNAIIAGDGALHTGLDAAAATELLARHAEELGARTEPLAEPARLLLAAHARRQRAAGALPAASPASAASGPRGSSS